MKRCFTLCAVISSSADALTCTVHPTAQARAGPAVERSFRQRQRDIVRLASGGYQPGELDDARPSGEFGADERGQLVGAATGDGDAMIRDLPNRVRVGENVV